MKIKLMHIYILTYIYIYIQGDNSLLLKRYEIVLKSEQIVCSQRILIQNQKLRPGEERN